MIFKAPALTNPEVKVLDLIREQWKGLRWRLQTKPTKWSGLLRRSALARGIRGSNSIEGLTVSDDDAAAAVDGEQPYDIAPEAPSWQAVVGYRAAMTHAVQQGSDPDAVIDATLLRSLHFMMMSYEPTKHPGSWRPGPIHVHDGRIDKIVYDAPSREEVPRLITELVSSVRKHDSSPLIGASMAHLEPCHDPSVLGRERSDGALPSDVGAGKGWCLDPVFCSVEEWLRLPPEGTDGNTMSVAARWLGRVLGYPRNY